MMVRKFPHSVTQRLLLCIRGRVFPHAPARGMQLLSLHLAQLGAGWGEPVSYVPFLTNFKKLGRLPLHGARTVRGAPDVLDLVATEAPAQMPGRGGGGWLDEMIDLSCSQIFLLQTVLH